jgi:hypothetical protein
MQSNVSKKRKYNPKKIQKAPKKDFNPYAPKITKELKYFDINTTINDFNTPTTGATFQLLNSSGAGAWPVNRIGNAILMKSIRLKGIIQMSGTAGALVNPLPSNVLRISIVYDKQNNNATVPPSWEQIFQGQSAAGTLESTGVFSNVNMGSRQRFIIIKDYLRATPTTYFDTVDTNRPIFQTVEGMGSLGMGSDKTGQPFLIDDYIKLKNLPAVYKSTGFGGTLADITNGSLWLITSCGSYSTSWKFQFNARITFKEENN